MQLETNLFSFNDFKTTLKKNFYSLLNSINETTSKSLIKIIDEVLDTKSNLEIPFDCIESLYIRVSNIVPHNNINKAKLNCIKQIILIIKNNNSQKHDPQQTALYDFVKKIQTTEIVEIGSKIQLYKKKIDELSMKKKFLISQRNNKITEISKDIDDYISLSITLNDPNELDKRDKRMIRTVIDVTHITNGLNLDIVAKNENIIITTKIIND